MLHHEKLQLTTNPFSRRMFLGGAGTTILLPFLASLVPEKVLAAASEADYRKAVFMPWAHGVYWKNWQTTNVGMTQIAPNVLAGSLSNATLAPYLPTDFGDLRSKITILEGLDLLGVTGHAHNTSLAAGGHAGGNDFEDARSPNSLDVILGKSAKVYATNPKFRVLRADPYGYTFTHCYENGSGMIMDQTKPDKFFQSVMSGISSNSGSTGNTGDTAALTSAQKVAGRKKLMVDAAIAPIQALMASTKVSSSDKVVASDFFDYLRDTQMRINADAAAGSSGGSTAPTPMVSCNPTYSAPGGTSLAAAKNVADTIVLALACGVTKLAYLPMNAEHDLVHLVNETNSRSKHVSFLRNESLPLASHMMKQMSQITEGNGKTLLDNSAVLVTSDLGSSKYNNHNGLNVSTLVGGGLNGMLRMGQFISYFNKSVVLKDGSQTLHGSMQYVDPLYGGRPYNEVLISIMRGFGLTNEYVNAAGGYGVYDYNDGPNNGSAMDTAQKAMIAYYNTTFLPSYTNKNVGLPYFYLGT